MPTKGRGNKGWSEDRNGGGGGKEGGRARTQSALIHPNTYLILKRTRGWEWGAVGWGKAG